MYIRPRSVAEALSALSTYPSQILSGGTDFFPSLGDRPIRETVVDVSALHELQGIFRATNEMRIGGLTTWTEIIRTPLPRCFDCLKVAAREIGSIQIQNRGTIAGNLCNASPAADGVPPLLALDAEVELTSSEGVRRIPLSEFIVGNRKTLRRADELLTAVVIPDTFRDASSSFVKLGVRRYLVISISMVAAVVLVDGAGCVTAARVTVGSCSAVAQRLRSLEQDLIGMPVSNCDDRVKPHHLSVLSPIDDVRATAAYRREASIRLVQRALQLCT